MARRSVIGKSKPYERKNRRVELPSVDLEFLGGRYRTMDWGLGGFRVDDFKAPVKKDQEFMLEGIGPAGEPDLLAVRIPCRAVRRNRYELSCSFIVLGSDAYDILEALIQRRQKVLEKLMKSQQPAGPTKSA